MPDDSTRDCRDAERLAALLGQLGYPTPPDEVPKRLAHLEEDVRAAALVAVRDDVVVGFATAHVQDNFTRGGDVVQLTTLVVADAMRGVGVGRQLVMAVEQFGRVHGCRRMTVTTANHRDGAHQFYERLGWEWTGRRYAKTLYPAEGGGGE